MALDSLAALDPFSAAGFPPGYSENLRTFFSPVDQVPQVLQAIVGSAAHSLVIAMYGFDDDALAAIIKDKMGDPNIYVQLTLDSSQAGGVHEKELLASEGYPSTSVAAGRSEKGAIMHLKMIVVDGIDVVDGSTNWSAGGETRQDNQLTVTRDAVHAALARSRIDAIHANMQQQMAAATARLMPTVQMHPGALTQGAAPMPSTFTIVTGGPL
jgi:phosphatidylserine/phosphatidylglycerophosphate/cardiolipin synthase-like enzyme